MCRIELVFTAAELKKLDAKSRAALTKAGKGMVQNHPDIRKIIKKDPKVCKALKTKLRPLFKQLARP
jgi:hypothetical protein